MKSLLAALSAGLILWVGGAAFAQDGGKLSVLCAADEAWCGAMQRAYELKSGVQTVMGEDIRVAPARGNLGQSKRHEVSRHLRSANRRTDHHALAEFEAVGAASADIHLAGAQRHAK